MPCPRPAPSTMSQWNGVTPIAVMYGYSIRRFAVGQDRACPVPTGLTPGGIVVCVPVYTRGIGGHPGCWCMVQTVIFHGLPGLDVPGKGDIFGEV